MTILQTLLNPILPVFAIVAIGYGLGRSGHTTVEQARALNRFALTLMLPTLLFGLIVRAPLEDFEATPIATYAAAEAVVFALGFALARYVFHRPLAEALLLAMAGIFSNTVLYVLPLSIILYGPGNILPVTEIVTLDSTLVFASFIIAMEVFAKTRTNLRRTLLSIAKTPLLIAMASGLTLNLLGVTLPAPVETFVDFNGAAAAPVAMFSLGVVLSQAPLTPDRTVVAFTLIKLAVFPLAVWAGLELTSPGASQQYILGSAGPAGAMAFSLALLYGVRTDAIAKVIIWSSVLTLGTLAALA